MFKKGGVAFSFDFVNLITGSLRRPGVAAINYQSQKIPPLHNKGVRPAEYMAMRPMPHADPSCRIVIARFESPRPRIGMPTGLDHGPAGVFAHDLQETHQKWRLCQKFLDFVNLITASLRPFRRSWRSSAHLKHTQSTLFRIVQLSRGGGGRPRT